MTLFDTLLESLGSPMDVLAGFNRRDALATGLKPSTVDEWQKLHKVYYGKTRFTRQQANAIRIARETNKALDQLMLIEKFVKVVSAEKDKWKLRHALLSVRGDYDTLKRKAKGIVPEDDRPALELTVRFGGSKKGRRPFSVLGDEHLISSLEYALRRRIDSKRPEAPQMYEAFRDLIQGASQPAGIGDPAAGVDPAGIGDPANGSTAGGVLAGQGIPLAAPRPLILIPLSEHTRILAGDGDETILGLSDGTTITGAEYLAKYYGEQLEVALFHPQAGAVNLYDAQRFANTKQRDLARATLTTCPVPGCRHAADNCEVHHIKAWARGGLTNMDNLAILCRYHNRTNDDDPAHKHRGRIEIRDGMPIWISPRGRPAQNERHPFGAMKLLFNK